MLAVESPAFVMGGNPALRAMQQQPTTVESNEEAVEEKEEGDAARTFAQQPVVEEGQEEQEARGEEQATDHLSFVVSPAVVTIQKAVRGTR